MDSELVYDDALFLGDEEEEGAHEICEETPPLLLTADGGDESPLAAAGWAPKVERPATPTKGSRLGTEGDHLVVNTPVGVATNGHSHGEEGAEEGPGLPNSLALTTNRGPPEMAKEDRPTEEKRRRVPTCFLQHSESEGAEL